MTGTIAAIDIGTNSIHLVVARVGEGNQFDVVAREKEVVRLGSSSGDMKLLTDDAVDRAVDALRRFRQVAEISDADVYAVATSAVREAENAHDFLDRARREAGIHVEVISGVEEARLIYLGALQAVPVFDDRILLIDIGGGSTEIVVGERGDMLAVGSLKLGAIRLTQRFFKTNRLHPGAVDSCRRHIRSVLAPMARDVHRLGFEVALGSSGTIEAVLAMASARRDRGQNAPPRSFNAERVTRDEVTEVVELLVGTETVDERRAIPGLEAARADIILAGALILEQAIDELGIEELTFSDYALREGVLLDALARKRGAALHHLQDIRRSSVLHLMEAMDVDPAHSQHVAALALQLFDATADRHRLGDDARELLEAAALLANVGLAVAHSAHHKHSYYVIRNSDRLAGFTDHEIELVALIARYHRKSAPKAKHAEYAALDEGDQAMVRALAAILRVAIALDRTHAQLVDSVRVHRHERDGDHLVVELVARDGADLSLERYTADERKQLLEEVLGARVTIAPADAASRS